MFSPNFHSYDENKEFFESCNTLEDVFDYKLRYFQQSTVSLMAGYKSVANKHLTGSDRQYLTSTIPLQAKDRKSVV